MTPLAGRWPLAAGRRRPGHERCHAGCVNGKTAPIKLSIPHQLGRVEARSRLQSGFANLASQVPGSGSAVSQRWEGDRLLFSVGAMGATVAGFLEVLDTEVKMEIELPGVLGLLAGRLKERMQAAGRLLLTRK